MRILDQCITALRTVFFCFLIAFPIAVGLYNIFYFIIYGEICTKGVICINGSLVYPSFLLLSVPIILPISAAFVYKRIKYRAEESVVLYIGLGMFIVDIFLLSYFL